MSCSALKFSKDYCLVVTTPYLSLARPLAIYNPHYCKTDNCWFDIILNDAQVSFI